MTNELISKAFITCVAGDGDPYVKAQFATLVEAQAFHDWLVASRSTSTDAVPEPWELEAAAIFMDHVDDDETESVHRVAAFLRRVAATHPSLQGGAEPKKETLFGIPIETSSQSWVGIGETGGTETGGRLHDRLSEIADGHHSDHDKIRLMLKAAKVRDERVSQALTSLRAERDRLAQDFADQTDACGKWIAKCKAAESSLAAEKLKVADLEHAHEKLGVAHRALGAIASRENAAADQRVAALVGALAFYRDNWNCKPNKRYGGLEYSPKDTLLDDCGNTARAALATEA